MKKINLTNLIVTVFVISWIGVLPSILDAHGFAIPQFLKSLNILMTLGPIIGAIVFISKAYGKRGIKEFFSRLLRFKANLFVIGIAVIFPILITLISAALGLQLSDTAWPDQFSSSVILTNGLMIFLMYLVINTEELVWRGVVFDRFLDKHGFVKSCLLLIPIWWLFHIPLFLFPGGHQAGYGIAAFTCIVIAETFILGWIYSNTNRSLLYVHLHHQLLNGFGQAFPLFPVFLAGNQMPVWAFCLLLLLTAGVLALFFPPGKNEKPKRRGSEVT